MSELGDLLELLHGARHRFATARLEGHCRIDHALVQEADEWPGDALNEAPEPSRTGVTEFRLLLWYRAPSALRIETEYADGRRRTEVVRDGRYWSATERGGWVSEDWEGLPDGPADLLEPELLLAGFEFRAAGRGVHAGREVVRATAVARGLEPWIGGIWGLEHELLVDAQVGVPLRVEGLVERRQAGLLEVTEVAWDEALDDPLFPADPPPEVARLDERVEWRSRPIDVFSAAAALPFPVFVVGGLLDDWRPSAAVSESKAGELALRLSYRSDEGHRVDLHETAAGSPQASGWTSYAAPTFLERDGLGVTVWETGPYHTEAEVILEGTRVRLEAPLGLDDAVRLLAALEPVPTGPPTLSP